MRSHELDALAHSGTTGYAKGSIQHAAIWNRALSDSEIMAIQTARTINPTPTPTQPPLVSNLVVASGRAYQWFDLASGQNMYIDRTYRFGSPIPASINGQFTLRTANDDKFSSANATHVSFTVNQASTVYVLYTTVNTTLESTWLTSANGWSLENYTVPTTLPGAESSSQGSKEDVCRWCDRDPQRQWVDEQHIEHVQRRRGSLSMVCREVRSGQRTSARRASATRNATSFLTAGVCTTPRG